MFPIYRWMIFSWINFTILWGWRWRRSGVSGFYRCLVFARIIPGYNRRLFSPYRSVIWYRTVSFWMCWFDQWVPGVPFLSQISNPRVYSAPSPAISTETVSGQTEPYSNLPKSAWKPKGQILSIGDCLSSFGISGWIRQHERQEAAGLFRVTPWYPASCSSLVFLF